MSVGKPTPSILVEGLKKPLRGGESIQVQLQFANAGIVPLTIPVITRSREFTSLPQAPGASAAPTPTPSTPPPPPPTDAPPRTGHGRTRDPLARESGQNAKSATLERVADCGPAKPAGVIETVSGAPGLRT